MVPPTLHIMVAWLAQQLGEAGTAAQAADDITIWAASQGALGALSLIIK